MFLFELDQPDPLLVRLTASTNQLKSDIDAGLENPDWTADELVQYYRDNGIMVDKDTLFDIIKKPPLNKVISNIQANKVVFKGQGEETAPEPDQDESQKVVSQMAHQAMK